MSFILPTAFTFIKLTIARGIKLNQDITPEFFILHNFLAVSPNLR